MRLPTANTQPGARFAGPPTDRMQGRPSRQRQGGQFVQAAAPAAGQRAGSKVNAKTAARAESFLAREQLLDEAVHASVINAGMRDHFARCYDADPAGTRHTLAALGLRTAASVQIQDAADTGIADDLSPLLTATERKQAEAAREGRSPKIIHGGL